MLRLYWCRLLPSSCSTVGRSVRTVEILNSHRSVGRLFCLRLSICPTVEAPGCSINTTTCLSKKIHIHWCHGSVLSGCINVSSISFRYPPMESYTLIRMSFSYLLISKQQKVSGPSPVVKTSSRFYYLKW